MSAAMQSLRTNRSCVSSSRTASRRSTVHATALFQSKPKTVKGTKEVAKEVKPAKTERKQGFVSGVVDALDFATPSKKDADILWETKNNWKKGESKMTPEQYAALARKVRGTAKDYFKEYVEEDRVENTYYKPTNSSGTVPFLPILVGVVLAMLGTTVFVVSQTS